MPDQGLTPRDAKIAKNVLACSQYVQRLAVELARKGVGFDIVIHGKGDAALDVWYTVKKGPIMPEETM